MGVTSVAGFSDSGWVDAGRRRYAASARQFRLDLSSLACRDHARPKGERSWIVVWDPFRNCVWLAYRSSRPLAGVSEGWR